MIPMKRRLEHPLTRGLPVDDPRITSLRRRIIREKGFLRRLYGEWYERIACALPPGEGPILELGSGAGFLSERLPGLITSEVFYCDGIRIVLDGQRLPFAASSLRAVVTVDVFHHLPAVRSFLQDATRSLRPGGRIIMIEPWVTPWSRWVYRHLHHEPFIPEAKQWEFASGGPLSGANGALPWIVFSRDRMQFLKEFGQLRIEAIRLMMPFAYLISGGVSLRGFLPGMFYRWIRFLEKLFTPYLPRLAMFAQIILQKTHLNLTAT
jgi:SAM-dependent methyltransferase